MKTLLVVMPQTWPTISTRVFKSFLKMTGPSAQKELFDRGIQMFDPLISSTFPIDRSRNQAADKALSNTYEADYVFFADGDQIWPENTLSVLLDAISDEFPVVSGLYWRKKFPFTCVQGNYTTWKGHELQRKAIEQMGFVDKDDNQCLFYQPLKDFDTPRTIDVSGMGCLLVRTDVFKKFEQPYFGYFNSYSLGGDFTFDNATEEMLFFCKLRKAGIKTWMVPAVKCGHEVTKVIGCMESDT